METQMQLFDHVETAGGASVREVAATPTATPAPASAPVAPVKTKVAQDDDWLERIMSNRPEVLLLVHALVLAGIEGKPITSEVAHNIPVSHPNCRGAAMKILRNVGFAKTGFDYGTTPDSHAHTIGVWKLIDQYRANRFLQRIREVAQKCQ